MNRALAALVALALVAALSLVPDGQIVGNSRAAAADCAWQRHSKRIVKHVRRDGRVRRTVRIKRWWTCNPLAEPPGAVLAPVPPVDPSPTPAPATEPPPRRVSVKAEEFSFTLSRTFVVAGDVTVELNNQGEDPHNLKLRLDGGEETPLEVGEAGPGESRVGHFTLVPGHYRLWCDLLQHDEWGMNVDLEVKDG